MAKKPTLTDLTSLTNQTTVVNSINNNNTAIEDAFENTLSLDGSTPNSMLADLDMNGNQILNLPTPTTSTDAVTKGYGDLNYGGAAATRAETAADAAEGFSDAASASATAAAASATLADTAADRAESAPERFIGTSASSVAIGVGSKSFVTQEDLFFNPGGFVLIVDNAAPTTNYMHGNIVDYTGTTLQVNVTNVGGSGTLSDWVIAVSGTRGAQGPTGPAGSGAGDLISTNNLSDLDDIPTAVSNLGLTIGTNVQAYDALLQAIAGLTTSAGQLIKSTGPDTVAMITVTSAGEALLDDADASAQRTTLGLGTAAVATLIDDDTMATATATNVPSAESVKAYVDTEVASAGATISAARLTHELASGSSGPTYLGGAYRKVALNTETFDPDGIVSISSSQFTLGAGTYMITANAPFKGAGADIVARIYNITDTATAIKGCNRENGSSTTDGEVYTLTGFVTIAGSKAFEFQVHSNVNLVAVPAKSLGDVEVYTELSILKIG